MRPALQLIPTPADYQRVFDRAMRFSRETGLPWRACVDRSASDLRVCVKHPAERVNE